MHTVSNPVLWRRWADDSAWAEAYTAAQANAVSVVETPTWQISWLSLPTGEALSVVWEAKAARGALASDAVAALVTMLRQLAAEAGFFTRCRQVVLAFGSAGADVTQPFLSLAALGELLDLLLDWRTQHDVVFIGVVLAPVGTYGGASLLLASVCQMVWCDELSSIHLLGTSEGLG